MSTVEHYLFTSRSGAVFCCGKARKTVSNHFGAFAVQLHWCGERAAGMARHGPPPCSQSRATPWIRLRPNSGLTPEDLSAIESADN
jgi:hypothetical protein